MMRRFAKRYGPALRQIRCANPRAKFDARKETIGQQDRSTGIFCEFFTPDTDGGNGKFKIEHWSFGRCTMIELFEAA